MVPSLPAGRAETPRCAPVQRCGSLHNPQRSPGSQKSLGTTGHRCPACPSRRGRGCNIWTSLHSRPKRLERDTSMSLVPQAAARPSSAAIAPSTRHPSFQATPARQAVPQETASGLIRRGVAGSNGAIDSHIRRRAAGKSGHEPAFLSGAAISPGSDSSTIARKFGSPEGGLRHALSCRTGTCVPVAEATPEPSPWPPNGDFRDPGTRPCGECRMTWAQTPTPNGQCCLGKHRKRRHETGSPDSENGVNGTWHGECQGHGLYHRSGAVVEQSRGRSERRAGVKHHGAFTRWFGEWIGRRGGMWSKPGPFDVRVRRPIASQIPIRRLRDGADKAMCEAGDSPCTAGTLPGLDGEEDSLDHVT
jgi:hypothetical protein